MPVDGTGRERIPVSALQGRIKGQVASLWAPLKFGLWRAVTLSYIYFWIKRSNIKAIIVERASWLVLVASLLFLLLEVILDIAHERVHALEAWYVRSLYIGAILLALYGKYREWRQHTQEYYFADVAKRIVGKLGVQQQTEPVASTVYSLLAYFAGTFSRCDGSVSVSLIEPDGALVVRYDYGNAKRDKLLRLLPGRGAAGLCCQEHCVVYVPRISFRHAIVQNIEDPEPFDLVEDLYEPDGVEDFRCVFPWWRMDSATAL